MSYPKEKDLVQLLVLYRNYAKLRGETSGHEIDLSDIDYTALYDVLDDMCYDLSVRWDVGDEEVEKRIRWYKDELEQLGLLKIDS